MRKIYLAGGCYWGVEFYLSKLVGVEKTRVGFMGGDPNHTSYEEVCSGKTGHAEVVEVSYDESKLSLKELLIYFFRLHDPTTLNAQKNDIGTQYRSAIFTNELSEQELIVSLIKKIDQRRVFKEKIVTSLEKVTSFHLATEKHQDYLLKNPHGYNCHVLAGEFDL